LGGNSSFVPLRINAQGNVECRIGDVRSGGGGCQWFTRFEDCQNSLGPREIELMPIACGDDHVTLFNSTGYDTPGHWCTFKNWTWNKNYTAGDVVVWNNNVYRVNNNHTSHAAAAPDGLFAFNYNFIIKQRYSRPPNQRQV
jgi:hypothetical protein